ncbi:hypothetical protein V1478_009064, partial [Vespula squamosa]
MTCLKDIDDPASLDFLFKLSDIGKVRFPIIGKADDREERKFGVATTLASSKQHALADCATRYRIRNHICQADGNS